MKRVLYFLYTLLAVAAFAACTGERDDTWVAVELVAAGSPVQVSRAADMNVIANAVIVVFKGGVVDQCKYVADYAGGGRVYLKRGGSYQIFAVANLADANCPEGSAAAYLDGVASTADLDNLYLLAAESERDNLIMCSELKSVSVPDSPLATADRTVALDMRRVQSRIELNVYNKISGPGGSIASGVEPHSYFTNHLPGGAWLRERSADRTTEAYWKTTQKPFPAPVEKQVNSTWYNYYAFEIITFENRRGEVDISLIGSEYDRKAQAPAHALEINLIGYANGKVLDTFVIPGKGRTPETGTWDNLLDYNVDRNCIYHINVYINHTGSIDIDSRRVYLETVVCGDLESPGGGSGNEF